MNDQKNFHIEETVEGTSISKWVQCTKDEVNQILEADLKFWKATYPNGEISGKITEVISNCKTNIGFPTKEHFTPFKKNPDPQILCGDCGQILILPKDNPKALLHVLANHIMYHRIELHQNWSLCDSL